jgi:hypothetical protein
MHIASPIQIARPPQSDGRFRLVARCDGRFIGSAYVVDLRPGFFHSEQWARAFLAACAISPMVVGVRS